jgi:hypothetical protein
MIKWRRMRWAGHIARIGKRNAYRVLVGRAEKEETTMNTCTHRKRRLQQFFVAAGTCLLGCYLETITGYVDPQTRTSNIYSIVTCIRWRGNVFTELLPSSERRNVIYWAFALPNNDKGLPHTDWREGYMKHAVEMGSGAVMYIPPSFMKTGSGIRKLMEGDSQTHSVEIAQALLHFF